MNDDPSLLCHVNLANGFRGGERQTFLLIESLAQRGFNQKLISKKGSELSIRCESISGLEVIQTNLFGLDAFLRQSKGMQFHFHDSRSFPILYFYSILKFIKLNYILTRRVERSPKINFISKKIYKSAKKVVCLSSSIANSIKHSFGQELDIEIIPSASANFSHDPNESLKIRRKIKQEFIVGHIGVLDDSHKGQSTIIELAREAENKKLNIGFLIVGSGRDEINFRRISSDLDNIYFSGHVDNIGDYLNAFDIFIFPSRHEGLGSSLLDALDFGLPIIASNAGGIPEIIEHGVNGFIVNNKSPSQYFHYLKQLHSDHMLRKTIAKKNKDKALEFSIERMTDSYINIY